MTRKDEGVVVKTARSGETSKHVTFFGRESGKVKLLAKGVLSAKSPWRAALEAGNVVEVVYYYKRDRTLYFLKEANILSTVGRERDSLSRVATILAALELIDQVCYWENPEERIVDLYVALVRCIDAADSIFLFLVFQFKLLDILGTMPDFLSCRVCGDDTSGGWYLPAEGTSVCKKHRVEAAQTLPLDETSNALLGRLASKPLVELARSEIDAPMRKRLGKIVHWTYTFHIQGYSLPEALKLIPRN